MGGNRGTLDKIYFQSCNHSTDGFKNCCVTSTSRLCRNKKLLTTHGTVDDVKMKSLELNNQALALTSLFL